jgi:hypothetical protein
MGHHKIEIAICTACGSYDWREEEVVHLNNQCRGKRDSQLVELVSFIPAVDQYVASR